MTHFITLVIIEPEIYQLGRGKVIETMEALLAPYHEWLKVEPYKKYETYEDEIVHLKKITSGMSHYEIVSRLTDYYGEPAGLDEEGFFYWSTYNPKSKWDWFALGGRWDGAVTGNLEQIPDYGAIARKKQELEARGVGGMSLEIDSWVTIPNSRFDQAKYNDNFANNCGLVGDIPEDLKYHAIVTPDGEWHEQGRMGWFAMMSDEKEDWFVTSTKLLGKYYDHYVLGVDCHI